MFPAIKNIEAILGLCGASMAGEASAFYFRQLRLLFDCGFYHRRFLSAQHIILSHGHIDHCGALFSLLGRSNLTGEKALSVYIPNEIYHDILALKSLYEKMNQVAWNWRPLPIYDGCVLDISPQLSLFCYKASHDADAFSFGIQEKKKRLRACYAHNTAGELQAMSRQGIEINEEFLRPLLFYSGDSDAEIFTRKEIFAYENLLMECTFLHPEHKVCAQQWRHLHLDDFLTQINKFQAKNLVLTHFSARYSPRQIADAVNTLRLASSGNVNIYAL